MFLGVHVPLPQRFSWDIGPGVGIQILGFVPLNSFVVFFFFFFPGIQRLSIILGAATDRVGGSFASRLSPAC